MNECYRIMPIKGQSQSFIDNDKIITHGILLGNYFYTYMELWV